MKLLEQVTLTFQEGNSNKVYEVDLLEVSPGQCVVNFRYGRRGSALKDGSKTVTAVPQAQAKRVFDSLVQSKIDAGYVRAGTPATSLGASPPRPPAAPPPAAPSAPVAAGINAARNQELLNALAQAQSATNRNFFRRGAGRAERPVERVVWRVGELRLREAEPLLLPLLNRAEPMRAYCVAWALGRMGSNRAVDQLAALFNDRTAPDFVRRQATESLLALSDDHTRAEFRRDQVGKLPADLQAPAQAGDAAAFQRALQPRLDNPGNDLAAVLETLYLIDSETVRPALLHAARTLPLKPGAIKALRALFKSAEFRRDGELFGAIAYRFEKGQASSKYRQGYNTKTRKYLRRRVWRTLRRMGEDDDVEYVRMAVGVLLPFSDADAVQPRFSHSWVSRGQILWDKFAPYWAFNHILYGNSPRFEPASNLLGFHLKGGHKQGGPAPVQREEAFPQLWEQRPGGLMHLLAESACAPVQAFAVKAIRACPAFLEQLDNGDVAMLLDRPYEPTAQLGFELAVKRMDASHEPRELLLALARCAYAPARTQALTWIGERREALVQDTNFLAGLITAPFPDTRKAARAMLLATMLSAQAEQALVGRIVAWLLQARPDQTEMAQDAVLTLISVIGNLSTVGVPVIRDLLASKLGPVREFGGELLLRKNWQAEPVPDDLLMFLLDSAEQPLRALGLRLLGVVPEADLLTRELLLSRLATSKLPDVRLAARGLLARLAKADRAAGVRVANLLLEALLRRKLPEGVPESVGKLLSEELADALSEIDNDTLWRLLDSADANATRIGAALLEKRGTGVRLEIPQAVRLASHDVLSVREYARAWFERNLALVRKDLPSAVHVLDARWEDSRLWAFKFFRETVPAEDFSLEVLVSICDSVKPEVQAFGRELITKHFKDADGQSLLLKLSEHPSEDVQLFASTYLDKYAANQPAVWEQLVPYFGRVLFQVNKSRVAKGRVLNFLRQEGVRGPEQASRILSLLHTLSATIAIEDRALALETMVRIHQAHPEVPLPVKVQPFEVRHGV